MTKVTASYLGLVLLIPAVLTAFLSRNLTIHNTGSFLFMVFFFSATAGYVAGSKGFQAIRPYRRSAPAVFALTLALALVCLGTCFVAYELFGIVSLKQVIKTAFQ